MGLVYSPTWMVDFHGFHVGKYTIVPWMRHGQFAPPWVGNGWVRTLHRSLRIAMDPMDENRWIPEKHQLLGIHQKYHVPKGPPHQFENIIFLGGRKIEIHQIFIQFQTKTVGFSGWKPPGKAPRSFVHLPCDPSEAGLAFDLLIESQDLSYGNGHEQTEWVIPPRKLTCSNGKNAPIFSIGNTCIQMIDFPLLC